MNFKQILLLLLLLAGTASAQSLYTAEEYFRETNKEPYKRIKNKQQKGDSLSTNEKTYVFDYENYLQNYYSRLSEEEKAIYQRMKYQWDSGVTQPVEPSAPEEFEWRNRDRFLNTAFGVYYGASIVGITEVDDFSIAGIPLITGGLWLLGPAINSNKYEGITQGTIRASSTGKTLGLGYGAALALAVAGEQDNLGKVALGLSSLGSIGLGELAFQLQKKKSITDTEVEMMRHYGFLIPGVMGSLLGAAETDHENLIGGALLASGIGGLVTGKIAAGKYNYSRGDVDVVNSTAVIAAGLGATLLSLIVENNYDAPRTLLLIPAAGAVAGTWYAQRSVRGVYLTRKQGSTINLTSTGAALIGIGIAAIAEAETSAYFGSASLFALITQQALFARYKSENLTQKLRSSLHHKTKKYALSLRVQPENYLVNKNLGAPRVFNPNLSVSQPLVNLTLKFR